MANQPITKEKLINADKDVQIIEDFIKKPKDETVTTRFGDEIMTLKGLEDEVKRSGGYFKRYTTLVAANADIANIPVNGVVKVADAVDGGDYYKASAGATILTKSAYDPLNQAKQYIDQKGLVNLQSFGSEILTESGLVNSGISTYYSRSGLIPIHSSQLLKIETQLYSINYICAFYDMRKAFIGTDEKAAENYNGLVKKEIFIPKNACFVQLMSANSTRPGYIPYSFSFEIFRKEFQNDSNELTIDYGALDKEGIDGSTGSLSSLYKYLIIPVNAGQTITYRELRASNVAPLIVYDESYNVLQSHNEFSKTVVLPTTAKYVLIQTFAKTHASYSDEWASKAYFKRGYADQLENLNTRLAVTQLSNEVEILKRGNTLSFTEANFTEVGTAETYNRTPKIETFGMRKLYIRGLVLNQGVVVRTYNAAGNITNFITGLPVLNRYNAIYELPADVVAVDVDFMNSTHPSYNPNYGRYVVLGRSDEDIFNELNKIVDSTLRHEFQIKNTHAFTSSKTYDSVRIPVYPSMQLKYSVAASGGSGLIVYDDGTQEEVYENAKTLSFDKFGYVMLSTYNSTHASFNPNFTPSYQILKTEDKDEIQNVKQFITGSYLPTPTLKAVREIVYSDGTHKTAIQYLWHDQDGNFFVSSTLRGDKKFIFKFESQNFYDSEPHHFSMGFDKYGNIVCVFRIEHLNLTGHTDSVRKNPIILMKDQGYKPIIVSLGGEALKPSGWLQNCGFLCTDEYIMLTEYTRPSVATANTWKATYPLTEAANWKTVQSFALSPEVNPLDNMKHIHNVDRDPFTGYIYTSTGDNNAGAAMFMSKDGGETFTTILSGSEKYCRVLNWVFTKDWIYWATDSLGSYHWFFKAPRNSLGEFDTANITDIMQFPGESWATYATIYMPKINALVFLARADAAATELPIDIYDLKNERFIKIDTLKSVNNTPSNFGFRCECFEWIPRGNEIACGFSRILGPGGYENKIGILGNTSDVTKKVNNLILTIDRFGDDFTISYDTVVL